MTIFKCVHASGRTYNDLKPENIMIEIDRDGEPIVCLIDFGLTSKLFKNNELQHYD